MKRRGHGGEERLKKSIGNCKNDSICLVQASDAHFSVKAPTSKQIHRVNSKGLLCAFVAELHYDMLFLSQKNFGRSTIVSFNCHICHLLSFKQTQTKLSYSNLHLHISRPTATQSGS